MKNQNLNNTIDEIKEELRKVTEDEKVKIALFGQPGAGKSSLINEIVGQDLAEVSNFTDTTVKPEPYEWNNLILMDLPGYGTKQFPKDYYWHDFDIGSYDLLLCVFSGKLHDSDTEFFKKLNANGKICIFVRNQVDTLFSKNRTIVELKEDIRSDVAKQIESTDKPEVIFTSCKTGEGIGELINKINDNLEYTKKECWERNAKAYTIDFLAKKKEACVKLVNLSAGAAALNGLNPIVGTDIAIDLGIITKLSKDLQKSFGISEEDLEQLSHPEKYATIAQVSNRVLKYASKEGLQFLLKRAAKKEITKKLVKFVPFVGPAISTAAGFALTYRIGHEMLEDYYTLAKEILENELVHN
ncbi:GTPase domain-containing protein [Paenibacillus odorifer]|uniref:GTPase domain-containing protein n=1 Tax=Paenibacillus odorifer TaxID=189426 RepID=UPI00096C97FB|nr:GTPase domain-containing protein [Paenibacillus odorifer]OME27748.1 hypothetical protein BSK57_03800 [Paenibacillus odorifer]